MLNWIFLILIVGATLTGAFTDRMKDVTDASFASAKTSVDLALSLIGQMALWLGLMRVLRDAGLMKAIGRALKPVMTRLFPDIPPEHPAMGAMIMNLASNMAGVSNAATPFGLKAMQELNKLNRNKGVATNSMALFLAINSAGVAVLPTGAIAVRAALGSKNAAGILLPSILATATASIVAIIAAKLFQGLPIFSVERAVSDEPLVQAIAEGSETVTGLERAEEEIIVGEPVPPSRLWVSLTVVFLLAGALALHFSGWKIDHIRWNGIDRSPLAISGGVAISRQVLTDWLVPLLMVVIVLFGFGHKVRVYESFVSGAKEGFQIAVMIIPYLVAILVSIGMFRASGALDAVVGALAPITSHLGIPGDVLPMALMKPLSGSGALGIMMDTMKTHGPDSLVGYMVSVMNAGSETTFYVLAVYYGSVQVRAVRHTLAACLVADLVGLTGAVWLSRLFFG